MSFVGDALTTFHGESPDLDKTVKQLQRGIEKAQAHFLNRDSKIFERELGIIHPSSFGDECDRMLVYQIIGAPRAGLETDQNFRWFENGKHYHERQTETLNITLDFASTLGIPLTHVLSDVPVICKALKAAGEIDNIVKVNGQWIILEWKSIKQERLKALTYPSKGYLAQVQAYLASEPRITRWRTLKRAPADNVIADLIANWPKVAVIGYENKNTQDPIWFNIYPDAKEFSAIEKRCKGINKCLTTKAFPKRCCRGQTQNEAMKCPFANTVCFDDSLTWDAIDRRHLQVTNKDGSFTQAKEQQNDAA